MEGSRRSAATAMAAAVCGPHGAAGGTRNTKEGWGRGIHPAALTSGIHHILSA